MALLFHLLQLLTSVREQPHLPHSQGESHNNNNKQTLSHSTYSYISPHVNFQIDMMYYHYIFRTIH